MIYDSFKICVEAYADKLALNNLTYKELFNLVKNGNNENIIYKILRGEDIQLTSSGSTGQKKIINLPSSMIYGNAQNAILSQKITSDDIILTVCTLKHTGGINAQTIAGLLKGAHVIIEPFNGLSFFRLLQENKITITHLTPRMINIIMKVKQPKLLPYLKLVVCGSDIIKKEQAEYWLNYNKKFMINYGLTEAGPIIINHTFTDKKELSVFDKGIPLGSFCYSEYKIKDNELFLRGQNVYINDWFATGDMIEQKDFWFFYKGRKGLGLVTKSHSV